MNALPFSNGPRRKKGETLKTRISGIGDRLLLDPPGMSVEVSGVFADLGSAFANEPG